MLFGMDFLLDVGHTGFEPVTSALSRQRSKPTELILQKEVQYRKNVTNRHTQPNSFVFRARLCAIVALYPNWALEYHR